MDIWACNLLSVLKFGGMFGAYLFYLLFYSYCISIHSSTFSCELWT